MSQVELNGQSFTLDRFPVGVEEASLQAWDAADEYLLQQVNEVEGPVLIFNDSFGALACALAEHHPVCINDSYIAELATQHNLRINAMDENAVTLQDSLSPLPANPARGADQSAENHGAAGATTVRAARCRDARIRGSSPGPKRAIFTLRRWSCSRKFSAQRRPRWHGKRRA